MHWKTLKIEGLRENQEKKFHLFYLLWQMKLCERIKCAYESSESYEKQIDIQKQAYDWEKDKQLRAIIVALSKFTGLEIELCGTWIYVRGENYPYRKELKALGLNGWSYL